MANFSNTIRTTIDVVSDKASAGVKSFRESIAEADGASGKLKAGFGQASGFIKENAAALAATAGTALLGFAANAVASFQNLALEAGKMSDTLGISTESASRWIEVAGDIGAPTEAVTKAMTRMEREVAKNPAQFDALGVSIARAADGSVDANETFLRTLEALKRIKDPTERQEAANKLLGRSWGEIAELVNGDVREAYESVSDAKLVSEQDVEDARAFRDTLDTLRGVVEDLSNKLAKKLLPVISDIGKNVEENSEGWQLGFDLLGQGLEGAARQAGLLKSPLQDVRDGLDELINGAEGATEATHATSDGFLAMVTAAQEAGPAAVVAAEGLDDTSTAAERAEDRLKDVERAWSSLMDELNDESSYLSVQDGFDAVKQAAAEAYEAAASGSADAEAKGRAYRQAVIDQTQSVLEYSREVLGIPIEKATTIKAMIDNGEIERAEETLRILTRNREVSVQIVAKGGVGYDGGISGKRAMGGPVRAGGLYEVNENGSELLTENGRTYLMAGSDGQVTPLGQGGVSMAAAPSGGQVVNIYANVIEKDTARWIVEQIAKARQTMGAATVQRAVNG